MFRPISYQMQMAEDFPTEFFASVATQFDEAYGHAYNVTYTNLPSEEAHDVLPSFRRGAVEAALIRAASAFPTVSAVRKLNKARNCYHVEVTCGRFVLTTGAVHHPKETVRAAVYRDNLLESPQMAFEFVGEAVRPDSDFYYGLLLHGPHLSDQRRIGFINVGFLDDDARGYISNFSLRDLYASAIGVSPADSSEEKIDDRAMPQIRRDIQNNDTQS